MTEPHVKFVKVSFEAFLIVPVEKAEAAAERLAQIVSEELDNESVFNTITTTDALDATWDDVETHLWPDDTAWTDTDNEE